MPNIVDRFGQLVDDAIPKPELARQLLADTREPVSAIALKVGFENPTYFASLFRARYGVAPSKYRDDDVSRK